LTIQGQPQSLNNVCVLCFCFSYDPCIYPRMSCMILIIWSWIQCTKFLWPPLKVNNGWLVVGIIVLLVIVLFITYQETILTPRTVGFVGKIVKQEHEVNNTWPLYLIKPFSSIFIELSDYSLSDDLTPHSSSMISPNLIFQSGSL